MSFTLCVYLRLFAPICAYLRLFTSIRAIYWAARLSPMLPITVIRLCGNDSLHCGYASTVSREVCESGLAAEVCYVFNFE